MFDSDGQGSVLSISPPLSVASGTTETGIRGRRHNLLLQMLTVIGLLAFFIPAFEKGAAPMDEGSLLVYPELLAQGKLPYRDFETFYGPANTYVLAASYSLFGTSITVERTIGLIYRALVLSLTFALIARWDTTLAIGCTALTAWILLASGIVAYAWLGGIVCILGSLLLLAEPKSNTRASWSGLLAGFALLFRPDLGPAVIVSALPLFLLLELPRRLCHLMGVAAGLLPLALLGCLTGPQEIVNNLFLYPVLRCNPARHLPISGVESYIFIFFITHLLAVSLNVIAGILAVRAQPRNGRARLLLSLALLGAALTPQAAQRLDLMHLISAAFASIGLLPVSLITLAARGREWQPKLAFVLLAVITVLAAVEAIAPELAAFVRQEARAAFAPGDDNSEKIVRYQGRSFPCPSAADATALLHMLHLLDIKSVPGERLFVGPADLRRTNYCDTFIYHLIPKLRPSSYFLEMNPFSANRAGSRLADDVASADWLVLNRALDTWREENRSLEFQSGAPNSVVRDQFQQVGQFGSFVLLRRRS